MNETERPAGGWPEQTPHQQRVRDFLAGVGHELPRTPRVASHAKRMTWCRLLLEETLELCHAAGFVVCVEGRGVVELKDLSLVLNHAPNLPEIAKESADVSVIATGMLCINGVGDAGVLEAVDNNNLLKVKTGHMCPTTGKWIKAPNHPKTDIKSVLKYQGWTE